MTYPMHDRMAAQREAIDIVAAFLEDLENEGLTIGYWSDEETLVPDFVSIRDRLGSYFRIDQDKLEDEKRAMLHAQRVLNGNRALPEKIKEALSDAQAAE